ncbi:MAG TPA: LapA family protein [Methylibium sp.]|uniref:LapA family protein n=1 Tax=Methylibium sp. TaxID=2067992 RepID=UPI002DB9898E|nr:LapA family protein [Methylibium sp.]HEU4460748.1 LapA family protein [Methylibium sp.]
MNLRLAIALLAALLFTVFVAVNWAAFAAPTTLSLLVAQVQAPLGLVMLVVLGVVVLGFALYLGWWQGRVLLETRRHTKELQSQRELADKAEASRFTELRGQIDARIAELGARLNERIDASTSELRIEVQHSANGLAASIGELEDRLQRGERPNWEPMRPG